MNKLFLMMGLLLPISLCAQSPDFTTAERFDALNLQKQIGNMQLVPFFLKKSNRFWFVVNKPGETGNTCYLVDPGQKQKTILFDKVLITERLAQLTDSSPDQSAITYRTQFSKDEQSVEIGYKGQTYDYNYVRKTLVKRASQHAKTYPVYHTGTMSGDKKWLLYARHHNLYLKRMADSVERVLSSDGAGHFSFSINDEDDFSKVNSITDAVWTSDSKSFYVLRKDTRKVQTMTVVNSVSSLTRPYVKTYKYELPGDKEVLQYDFFVGNPGAGSLTKVNIDRWQDQEVELLRNQSSNEEVFLLRSKRTRDEMELCAVNVHTGALRIVVHELSKPFINKDLFQVSIINGGKDIIWWSDRSGWGQYYHYDRNGRLLNTVTQGDWTAGKTAAIDTTKRMLYFYGYGKEKDHNPNYAFLYKVNIDGGKPQLLTPENANHAVFISPSKHYFLDQYSRIDLEPVSVLRSTSGKFIQEVYRPDLSKLYAYGWKRPEMFTVKAKDGMTDLYGLMWKPFNFDPNKKYPVISQVYPGPFTETVSNEFTVIDRYNNTSLAQVGFIVVCMGHRGGSPLRGSAYYKYGYGNLRDYALEDDKYGLEQLAERYSFIDLNKVGITGHSGGGAMAAAAICTYPDFYKVAVASSGNYDNSIYNRTWGEIYEGVKSRMDSSKNGKPLKERFVFEAKNGQSLAGQLKGKLLLVAGESDANVNPGNTMRMVDALIKANKDFELLILPGQSHTYEGPYKSYYQRKQRKFFAKYLYPE